MTPKTTQAFSIYKDAYVFWWNARSEWKKVEKSGSSKLKGEKHHALGIAYEEMKKAKIELDQAIVRENQ